MLPFASQWPWNQQCAASYEETRGKSRPLEEIVVGGMEWLVTRSVKHSKVGNKEFNLTVFRGVKSIRMCCVVVNFILSEGSFMCLWEHKWNMQIDDQVSCFLYKILCMHSILCMLQALIPFSFEHLIWPTKWMELTIECTYQSVVLKQCNGG